MIDALITTNPFAAAPLLDAPGVLQCQAGSRVLAYSDNGLHDLEGTLAEDCFDFDGVVAILSDDDGKIYRINGWLWSIEVEGE